MSEMIPCTSPFSNGTEFEWFIETQCERCTRLRNGQCRVYKACWYAYYGDMDKFPYNDLLEYKQYAGKKCKHWTDKPIEKKRKEHIIKGQISFSELNNE